MKRITCSLCGKEFDEWDEQEDFSIHRRIGYGSRYDGCELRLDLCCRCLDALIDKCVLSPVEENGDLF